MALTVDGYLWIADERSSFGTDHLVPKGTAFIGEPVHTLCGLDLVATDVRSSADNGRSASTGGGFDVGDSRPCGNVACKACLDQTFQLTPIPNGSEKRPDGKSKR